MPSLQQLHANDCGLSTRRTTSAILPAISTTTKITETLENMRALTGADILQKHSINSILEGRQDFLSSNNDMISDTLVSPNNDPIAETNLFGLRKTQHNNAMFFSNNNNGITNPDGHRSVDSSNISNYTPLTPTNSTQCSISPGTLSANSYDVFQFENIAQNQIMPHQQQPAPLPPPPTTTTTQQPLKVGFQRNISFDCSAPLSPSTPTSLYNRSFSSPLVSDSSTSSSANGLSLDSIPLVYQNNYSNGVYGGVNNNNNNGGGGILSRSNSPESDNSNHSTSDTQNLIDMMNILNVKNDSQLLQHLEQNQQMIQQQQKQQQQQHFIQQQQQQQQQQQTQQSHQQQQFNHNHVPIPNLKFPYSPGIHFPAQNALPSSTTTGTPLTTINNLFDEQNLQNFEALTVVDFELTKYQNLQTLNALKLLQSPQIPFINQLFQGYNQLKNITPSVAALNDAHLDRVAKFYRSSAALCDATCTWSGQLPKRTHRIYNYSPKVFLGGIPWDISEQSLIQIFKPFGQIKVEWPGKDQHTAQPKGFAYIIFESDKQVKALLSACVLQVDDSHSGCIYYYKISSRRIKAKDVEVKPWFIADSNFVKSTSQKLDPTKTVFVGALHGKLTAEGLAKIMDDLFDGVLYAGIDTDKYKYPIGSGRVTFNNNRSYMKAVSAAFIEIRTSKFTKKVQVDPYLEDSLCSICGVQHGPYYCRELSCFRYFCRACWQWQHTPDSVKHHKPLTRNSKSQTLVGIGPTFATSTWNLADSVTSVPQHTQQNQGKTQFAPQRHQYQHTQQVEDSMYSLDEWLEARQKQ